MNHEAIIDLWMALLMGTVSIIFIVSLINMYKTGLRLSDIAAYKLIGEWLK